ncbi:MAG: TetR/AcrR family transcriptional regulator, partial [Pseudolabrys sp.]|nr:TetR/AcrR family transcriptional regulator [Pseudolabrys sp.]
MPYRRTENVVRRLAEREKAILDAAIALASEGGMAAVQIVAVAGRAGIAAGTVYRYFPTKNDLVAELIAAVAGRELEAMQAAADAAPGPLSALASAIARFSARALAERRLAWAVIGEAVDAEVDVLRMDFRQ